VTTPRSHIVGTHSRNRKVFTRYSANARKSTGTPDSLRSGRTINTHPRNPRLLLTELLTSPCAMHRCAAPALTIRGGAARVIASITDIMRIINRRRLVNYFIISSGAQSRGIGRSARIDHDRRGLKICAAGAQLARSASRNSRIDHAAYRTRVVPSKFASSPKPRVRARAGRAGRGERALDRVIS
jgi:hypothetical protein